MCEIYENSVDILFDGDKNFWEERCKLDVFIALHTRTQCLEIVIYDPNAALEYPRMYMDFTTCKSKIDQTEFRGLVEKKLKIYNSNKKKVPMKLIEKEAQYELIPNIFLTNMEVKPKVGFPGCFNVYLFEQLLGNKVLIHVLREKPVELQAHPIDRIAIKTPDESSEPLKKVGQRQRTLLIEEKFLKSVAVSAIEASTKVSPLEAKNRRYQTRAKRRWKAAIRRVIFLQQVQRFEAIIRHSRIGGWYSRLKNDGTTKNLKMLQRVTNRLINVRRLSVLADSASAIPPANRAVYDPISALPAHLPLLHSNTEQSSLLTRRRHSNQAKMRRSQGSLSPPPRLLLATTTQDELPPQQQSPLSQQLKRQQQQQQMEHSPSTTARQLPPSLNLTAHQQSLLLDEKGSLQSPGSHSNSNSSNISRRGTTWLEKKSNESLRKVNRSLSPTRAIQNDPFFKEENNKVRSLSPICRGSRELTPLQYESRDVTIISAGDASDASGAAMGIGETALTRHRSSFGVKPAVATAVATSPSGCKGLPPPSPQHRRESSSGALHVPPLSPKQALQHSFADQISKLEQNVSIQKFARF